MNDTAFAYSLVILIPGIILILVAFAHRYNMKKGTGMTARAEAEVVRVDKRTRTHRFDGESITEVFHVPIFVLVDDIAFGRNREMESLYENWDKSLKAGDRISVLYDPHAPERGCMIPSHVSQWRKEEKFFRVELVIGVPLAVVGTYFLLAAIGVLPAALT